MSDKTLFDNPELVSADADAQIDKLFESMGVEAEYVPDHDNGIDIPQEYDVITLKDMYDDDEYEGKPFLSEIITREYEDKKTGEKQVNYSVELVLIDDDSREAYIYPIKLKDDNVIQENIHHASKLFSLIGGIWELKCSGITQRYNYVKKVDLNRLKKMVDSYDTLSIRTVEIFNKDFSYNDFVITGGE